MNQDSTPTTQDNTPGGGQRCLIMILTIIISFPLIFILVIGVGSAMSSSGRVTQPHPIWGLVALGIIAAVNQGVKAVFNRRSK